MHLSIRSLAFVLSTLAVISAHAAAASTATSPATSLATSLATRPMRIVIDPGHGGQDAGAHRGNIKESDIALQISKELKELLSQDPHFKSLITRDTDRFITLEQRTQFAETNKADLMLSIHANSSPDPHAQGPEFYFQNLLAPGEETQYLASRETASIETPLAEESTDAEASAATKSDLVQILNDLKRNRKLEVSSALSHMLVTTWDQQRTNSGHHTSSMVRQAPYYVVSKTTMPSVLVEVGFVTHAEEGPRLTDPERQKQIAQQIYKALIAFREKSAPRRTLSTRA